MRRALAATARAPALRPVRALAGLLLPPGRRVVRVRSGPSRGMRMSLDLRREKAYWLGLYEREVQEFLRVHAGPDSVVYDVGANIGYFSLCAAALGAHVVAFEVVPENVVLLQRNVELNDAPVEVVPAAAWDADGEVAIVAGDSSAECHAVPGRGAPAVALDSFTADRTPPDVLKIDVEGAEARVLDGAAQLLEEAQPVVVCEVHGPESKRAVRERLAGYRLRELGSPWRLVGTPAN